MAVLTKKVLDEIKLVATHIRDFANWIILGLIMGVAGGILGALFHICVDKVTEFRTANGWVLFTLPVIGVLIALLYRKTGTRTNANDILDATRSRHRIPVRTLPVIFVSTVLTQLGGGSAGKEGAAIQMGGTIGYQLGRLFKLDEKDLHVSVMCGLSAVFAAVFGTPITAAFFALEVISIGAMYYVALIPCITAVLVALEISTLAGIKPLSYAVTIPGVEPLMVLEVLVLALACALVSILFCAALHRGSEYAKKLVKNSVLRAAAGGALLILMTLAVGNRDYNGAGFNLVTDAIAGNSPWYAFALKIIFTAVTISFGFKGGEIVPTMAVGATLGCAVAALFGVSPGFFAAIGLLAMFCSMVNCPVTSIVMGIELFGSSGVIYYAVAATVAFALSGDYGLYSSQKLLYSKLKAEFININIK